MTTVKRYIAGLRQGRFILGYTVLVSFALFIITPFIIINTRHLVVPNTTTS